MRRWIAWLKAWNCLIPSVTTSGLLTQVSSFSWTRRIYLKIRSPNRLSLSASLNTPVLSSALLSFFNSGSRNNTLLRYYVHNICHLHQLMYAPLVVFCLLLSCVSSLAYYLLSWSKTNFNWSGLLHKEERSWWIGICKEGGGYLLRYATCRTGAIYCEFCKKVFALAWALWTKTEVCWDNFSSGYF